MSRIEEALRKASSKRPERRNLFERMLERPQAETESVTEDSSVPPPAGVRKKISSLLDVVPIKIDHLLLATARDEKNAVVEEFNKLRSSVLALTKGEPLRNTLMVTSTVSEEGKSMTSLNLAISLAKEQDHTVLLVDTDLRRPSIHKYLGLSPDVGLVHCLRDGAPLDQALIKTGVGKLVVLPAGEAVKDPLDLISSQRMRNLVTELKVRYPDRYVIFDTPPALPFADAGVLADIVDCSLFVVREGQASRADVEQTLAEFKGSGLLGVVYNDAHSFRKKNSYYYY